MVDPVQAAIGAFAGRAATRAINSLLGPENYASISQVVVEALYSVEDEQGGIIAILTDAQYNDLEQFVESKEVGSLLQSWAVLKIDRRDYADGEELLSDVQSAFEELVKHHCEGQDPPWSSIATDVWRLITSYVEAAIPAIRDLVLSTDEKSELFARFSTGSQMLRGGKTSAPRYIRDLVEIFGSTARLTACRNVVSDIRRATEDAYRELSLAHAHDEYRIEVDKLYVDRTLKGRHSDAEYESDFLLSAHEGIPRLVVIGDPGAGKSTLVHHTAYRVIHSLRSEMAPVVIQCREYAANSWGSPLTTYATAKFETDESIKIDESVIVDVLTLGCAYVIFDGVDEIIDLTRRRTFIRRIESFGRRFPYVPILATARRVGYGRATFNDQDFQLFELNEFSDTQVSEYVRKWFGATRRESSEMDAFLRETDSISDIRCNPLMLSLLCTLYRARGFIPRNRRQVYRECSELLFQRWDAMRHIEQPFDHRHYGQRLMQELARFFYTSQSAQGGLEEQQLVKIIAIFFRDTASIDPPDDQKRAQQFVDFCADRAWLLSAKGYNSRGNRLFAFTHRTFMEFYAAECLVRMARDVDEIANTIIKAFEADPSSVVPDVMVQAFDETLDRGAEQILKHLLDRGRRVPSYQDKYLSLCLRIVNSSPMSRAISDSLPSRISEYWTTLHGVDDTYESSMAFFELYRDPRAKMIDSALRSLESNETQQRRLDRVFATEVCSRWARFEALGIASYFEPEWFEMIGPVFDRLAEVYVKRVKIDIERRQEDWGDIENQAGRFGVVKIDAALADYFVATSRVEPHDFDRETGLFPQLCVPSFGNASPGILIDALYSALTSGANATPRHLIKAVDWHMGQVVENQISLKSATALDLVLSDQTAYGTRYSASQIEEKLGKVQGLWDFALWLMFVSYEAEEYTITHVHEWFDGVIGLEELRRLFATRDHFLDLDDDSGEQPLTLLEVRDSLRNFSSWTHRWVAGDLSLTQG